MIFLDTLMFLTSFLLVTTAKSDNTLSLKEISCRINESIILESIDKHRLTPELKTFMFEYLKNCKKSVEFINNEFYLTGRLK